MAWEPIHRFDLDGKRFAIDTETCFCFECDEISWDVLEHYPHEPVNRIYHLLEGKHDRQELQEVVGELEWLRATKSILPAKSAEEQQTLFDIDTGLKSVAVLLGPEDAAPTPPKRPRFGSSTSRAPTESRDIARNAIGLLLGRSEKQTDLEIEFIEDKSLQNPDLIAELCEFALKSATLAGKALSAEVRIRALELTGLPKALEGHTLSAKIGFRDISGVAEGIRGFAKARLDTLKGLQKAFASAPEGVRGKVIVRPNHPDFGQAIQELDQAGFPSIELDLDGAYIANPQLEPSAMLEGVARSAQYYAERLLAHHYFRLDPIASQFWRIHNGTPLRRSDPTGTNALAVDGGGTVYPSVHFIGMDEFRAGSVLEGCIDEALLKRFEDVGSLTTSACIECWARNLCGGGSAAVHQALTGSFRQPHTAWCDAQRVWLRAAVSAFNVLSSAGVNFTRVHGNLGRSAKPSLFTLARAAFRMNIGMRPLEEADAPLLTEWENWTRAAYFLLSERAVLLGNQYEREMDALHPRDFEFETLLLRKDGAPFGLFKVVPARLPGLADVFLYFHNEEDYASDTVRKGFRTLLKEASAQQSIRRIMAPAAPWEEGLQAFLEATGFKKEGVQHESLFSGGVYHDVHVYSLTTDSL